MRGIKLFALSLFVFLASALFLVPPQKVGAEPAQCYELASSTGDDGIRLVDCGEGPVALWLELEGITPQNDTCYAVNPSGEGIYKPPQPKDSETCQNWRRVGTATTNTPAKCTLVEGASITDLADGSVEVEDYKDVECNDALLQNIRDAGNVIDGFEAGKCYVITAEGYSIVPTTCATAFIRAVSDDVALNGPQAGQIPLNVDREEIRNCGAIDENASPEEKQQHARECLQQNPIVQTAYLAINILSSVAAIAIITAIVVGGIQYSTAGANPQAVSAAKGRIISALVALLALTFLFSFLQWLIPGGIF